MQNSILVSCMLIKILWRKTHLGLKHKYSNKIKCEPAKTNTQKTYFKDLTTNKIYANDQK